jgi:chorismate-pyruvate lyase
MVEPTCSASRLGGVPRAARRFPASIFSPAALQPLPCRNVAVLQLSTLAAPFFPSLSEVGEFSAVTADELPEDYRVLLAHDDHMTVTVEAFHGCLVDVRVLQQSLDADVYSRASLLACQSTGQVVQFGVMRINLRQLSDVVREEIVGGRIPLGRALIRHNVLRHVELQRLWQVNAGPALREYLQLTEGEPAYGRSARIVVEGRPAVELLEIPRA